MSAHTRPRPALGDRLEALYQRYNRRAGIESDPVRFVHGLDLPDREIAALVASALAYGRVGHILKSVARALSAMPSPAGFLAQSSRASIRRAVGGFRHRFTTADDLAVMLCRVKEALARWGSLERCFASGMRLGDETVVPALAAFVEKIAGCRGEKGFSLLPSPAQGSACKRLNLFLRWMVRRDEVDPGGWSLVPASKLVVPLDTHMHRISRDLGFTRRGQADLRTALEVTAAFRKIVPGDPVRYDFTLTHLGISGETRRLFPRLAACAPGPCLIRDSGKGAGGIGGEDPRPCRGRGRGAA